MSAVTPDSIRHRITTIIATATVTALLGLSITACSVDNDKDNDSSVDTAQDGQWPRTVDTPQGKVEIPAKPKKIVSTSVTLTGTLLTINAPVVASGATSPNTEVADDQGFFTQWGNDAKEKGIKSIYQGEPNLEAILKEEPDLVVVAATGGDSTMDLYDKIKSAAPTVVVDYGDKDWQEIATTLGEITGHEKEAQNAIKDFDGKIQEIKDTITLPEQPVTSLVYQESGGANVWTKESAQNKLLSSLGFTIANLPDELRGNETMGKRNDIVEIAPENLSKALNGQTAFLINADEKVKESVLNNGLLKNTPSVSSGRVYPLGLDTFRLDAFSSMHLAEKVKQYFG